MQIALYSNAQATDQLAILTVPESPDILAGYSVTHRLGTFEIDDEEYTYFGQGGVTKYGGGFIPNDLWGKAFSGYLLPDPDAAEVVHDIYTATGSRIRYVHYMLDSTTARLVVYHPQPFNGTEYLTPISMIYPMISTDYTRASYRPILYFLYAPVAHCLAWDNTILATAPCYVPFIKSQIVGSGSLTDPFFGETSTVTLYDVSTISPVYKPTKNTRRGGRGSGNYHGVSNGERPDVATRNAVTTFGGSGDGLTYYQLGSLNGLHHCINYAYELGVLRDNQYIRDAMVSAYLLPVITINKSSASGVRIADNTINDFADPLMSIDILDQEHIAEGRDVWYDFGEYDGWGDQIDFTLTDISLFLPFVGTINIDASACMYGRITIKHLIDAYNGNIIYYVYTQSVDADTDTLYGTYTGNAAIEIPLCGAGQSGSVLGKITNAVSSLAVGAASIAAGNPITAAGAALGMLDSAVPTYKVDRSGAIDANGACLAAYRISLKISMPIELRDDTQLLIGHSSYFRAQIGDLPRGRHVVSAVEIDTLSGATDNEKARIKQIMEGGIYIK